MIIQLVMPSLSMAADFGRVAAWRKQDGDRVLPGEVVAEIVMGEHRLLFGLPVEAVIEEILVPEDKQVFKDTPLAVFSPAGAAATATRRDKTVLSNLTALVLLETRQEARGLAAAPPKPRKRPRRIYHERRGLGAAKIPSGRVRQKKPETELPLPVPVAALQDNSSNRLFVLGQIKKRRTR